MTAKPREVCLAPTSLGIFTSVWSQNALLALRFPRPDTSLTQVRLSGPARVLQEDLQKYLKGQAVDWRSPLDFSGATAFQRRVWQGIASIPFGEVRSYTWLAEAIDQPTSARAVANACGANPLPIVIPCHRVVASNGSLGGFSAGLAWKKKLLALERSSTLIDYTPLMLERI